jgi:hypothetical protein
LFSISICRHISLRGRSFANQQTEAKIMANILNKMTHLGMPKSEKIYLAT